MEYQKIVNLLNDGSSKPPKFKTRNWVEINDEHTEVIYNEVHTLLINKLNLRHQCKDLVYVIIVMHIYLLKEIYQLIILLILVLLQIILIKN